MTAILRKQEISSNITSGGAGPIQPTIAIARTGEPLPLSILSGKP